MTERKSNRPCPICGGRRPKLIYRQRFLQGPMGNGYDVVVCKACGAGYADGIRSQLGMERYYSNQSKYARAESGGAESNWDVKRFQAIVEQLIPYLSSREARILDIGCATAGLLSAFRAQGYRNIVGADPAIECARGARRLHNIKIRVATIAKMEEWDERFDLVTMVGVLEHLRDVKTAIRTVAHLLAPNGLLYCAVPDVQGMSDCANAPYQQFSVEHVNFFSVKTLDALLSGHGMSALKTWRNRVEWRERVYEPVASGIYKSGPTSKQECDPTTEAALKRYVMRSARDDVPIASAIESLKKSGEPIIVWGAGTLARRLLATTALSEANIVAFVDSNPLLKGTRLAGRPILAPEKILKRKESIVVCSGPFGSEIVDTIRTRMRLANPIILLQHLAS